MSVPQVTVLSVPQVTVLSVPQVTVLSVPQVTVLSALSQVVNNCNNFKVRINAALALSVPSERRHYGEVALYVMVWESLVGSLKTAEDITDFAEFRYKDSLTEQVSLEGSTFLTSLSSDTRTA